MTNYGVPHDRIHATSLPIESDISDVNDFCKMKDENTKRRHNSVYEVGGKRELCL